MKWLLAVLVLAGCNSNSISAKQQTVDCKAGCEQRGMRLIGAAFQSGEDDTVCICEVQDGRLTLNSAAQAILPLLEAAKREDEADYSTVVASFSAAENED